MKPEKKYPQTEQSTGTKSLTQATNLKFRIYSGYERKVLQKAERQECSQSSIQKSTSIYGHLESLFSGTL